MLIRSDDSLPADRVYQTITSPTLPPACPPLFPNDLVEFVVDVVFDGFEPCQRAEGVVSRSYFLSLIVSKRSSEKEKIEPGEEGLGHVRDSSFRFN